MTSLKRILFLSFLSISLSLLPATVKAFEIGVFYFPGWNTGSRFWKDLKGEPGSRSPGIAWPDREPLLGHYPEEEVWVAEKHIEWAAAHDIDFFAYDWYWYGKNPDTEHAQQAFLKAKNRKKLKFCLLWANHNDVPRNMQEFDDMVDYWLEHYFKETDYVRIDGKPVLFIFSYTRLEQNASGFRQSVRSLLARAEARAREKGRRGIYFIATTNERPGDDLERRLTGCGFSAYTAWNYVLSGDGARVADYDSMVDTYLDFYQASARTAASLPYLVPASPGFDDRPWYGSKATVRSNATPEKFERMLRGARERLEDQKTVPRVLMIEAWNEFAEGSMIEPSKKWGFAYLEKIRKVFSPAASKASLR